MVHLEKYRGSRSRYTCPNCGHRNQFVRYLDENGEYIADEVGRCNRESSCGYHLTPKQYFEMNNVQCSRREHIRQDERKEQNEPREPREHREHREHREQNEQFDTIDNSFVVRSLEHTGNNRFLTFLFSFIDAGYIFEMARRYFVGGTRDGKTVFWQIDKKGRARTGKILSYIEQTGKRDKKTNPSWIHYELKRHKLLPDSFQHQLCFFGEHLLRTADKSKPVAVVEAEKTACIASIFLDNFVWLAVGGKSYLKAEKLRRFGNRKIVLFPDADGFDLWEREAADARALKLNVTTSRLIEEAATAEERKNGFDLADYLIHSELEAQKHNRIADAYNEKVNDILEDADLWDCFNELIDERIAIAESEAVALSEENLRATVSYF